jgi:hypothetical protein
MRQSPLGNIDNLQTYPGYVAVVPFDESVVVGNAYLYYNEPVGHVHRPPENPPLFLFKVSTKSSPQPARSQICIPSWSNRLANSLHLTVTFRGTQPLKGNYTNSSDITINGGDVEASELPGGILPIAQPLIVRGTNNVRTLAKEYQPALDLLGGASTSRSKRNAEFIRIPTRIYRSTNFTATVTGKAASNLTSRRIKRKWLICKG